MILKTSYKMKPPVSARLIKGHSLSKGLVGLWLFNEGSGNTVQDLSGVNTGTITGGIWISSKFGSGVDLEWSSRPQYISFGDKDIFTFSKGFTLLIEASLESLPDGTNGCTLFEKYQTSNLEYLFGFHKAGGLYCWIYDQINSAYIGRYVATPGISVGDFHQYIVTWDGGITASSVAIYIDGVRRDDNDFTAGTFASISNTTAPLRIGGNTPGLGGDSNFDGIIDNGCIYNHDLSVSEIALLYREPFCMFDRPMDPLFSIAGAPPEIQALFMDLSTQIWTIKHATGLFTKL